MRFKTAAQNVNWVMVGSIAAVVVAVVAVLTYYDPKPNTEASGESERVPSPSEPPEKRRRAVDSIASQETHESGVSSEPVAKTQELGVDSDQPGSDVVTPPDVTKERVALGYTVEELRKVNGLREMLPLEEGQELSSLSGVFGFVHYLILNTTRLRDEVDFPVKRHRWAKGVEVHKTANGNAMLLVYVDESTAARLGDSSGEVGSIFGFFKSVDEHAVLVGLPIGRVLDWEHRASHPNGFAEIRID